jgi:aldehyde dehydrogenase (NAD(P)+)
VNTWTGLGYGLGTTPWGVPPGAPRDHGSGFAHQLAPQPIRRVVVASPLRPWPTPPWLPHARHGAATLRALTLHTLRPSLATLARTVLHAVR